MMVTIRKGQKIKTKTVLLFNVIIQNMNAIEKNWVSKKIHDFKYYDYLLRLPKPGVLSKNSEYVLNAEWIKGKKNEGKASQYSMTNNNNDHDHREKHTKINKAVTP